MFFDFCKNSSELVNREIIDSYKNNEVEFTELKKLESKIKKKLSLFKNRDDSFDDEDYNLKDFFFQFEDYETFFYRNERLKFGFDAIKSILHTVIQTTIYLLILDM